MSASEPTNDEVIRPPMAEEEFGGNKRDLIGWNATLLAVLCITFTLFHLYVLMSTPWSPSCFGRFTWAGEVQSAS